MSDYEHPDAPPAPAKPAAPRTLDDWTATVAAAALVAGGFLVTIAGPMLRKLYDARRAELAEARELVEHWHAVAGQPAEADEPGGQADAEAAADESYGTAEAGSDVWAAAADRWQNGHPGVGVPIDELTDPAATVPDAT